MEKMSFCRQWRLPLTHQVPAEVADALRQAGWHIADKKEGENELLFGQKYRWSRMGVYLVHLSILVIFSGAIIGHFLGFKASVMIPEMRSVAQVYGTKDSSPIALGFDLRCDAFTIDFYDNGMPKDYKSKLTILKNDQILLQKEIEVNSPLSYRGITFYQASYEAYRDFIFAIADKATGKSQRFIVPFQEQRSWEEQGVIFGVINAEALGQRVVRSKIWFKSADNPATTIWLADNATTSISSGGKEYDVTVKQMYATGLQVAKDPGVWVVYIGCVLMMMGLFMAFFMAHQRIWLYRQVDASGITIYLSGSTNKNKPAFAKRFERLEALVDQALNR
jgi:cytochrome c biogenesis protein